MARSSIIAALLAIMAGGQWQPAQAASAPADPAVLVETIAAGLDPRVSPVLSRIDGPGRRLLALRAYLRAGNELATRWSWTVSQIAAFGPSPENRAMQAEIARVRQAFVAANPGFDLWVNPQVRSVETQLANWNGNDSVSRAARHLYAAFSEWLRSTKVMAMSPAEVHRAAMKFLRGFVPVPTPTHAAPGLSPHGQMRAVDFQVRKGSATVAGPQSATIASRWDAAGWTQKLNVAVRAGSDRFTGPLASPREPWHYTYSPAP